MRAMDPEDLIQRFMDPGHTYTYKECNRRGHEWGKRGWDLFPWGWRLPWLRRGCFKKCQGCGIYEWVQTRYWVWPKFRE